MRWARYQGNPYRMHTPKWAITPTSGAGASLHGGRLNRIGLPALYLSVEAETAIAEYKQASALMPPGTLVQYRVDVPSVIDFSAGYNEAWDPLWKELNSDWRRMWFNERIEPPSWLLGDAVLSAGGKGVLFRSLISDGLNLVIYPDQLSSEDTLEAIDPGRNLPNNQRSWE